jgi:hypothetical protein
MDSAELLRRLAEVTVDVTPAAMGESATAQLTSVCATARAVFRAASVSVAVIERGGLRYVAASGTGAEGIVGELLPVERGLAGYVAATGQSLAVDRPADDPRFAHDVAARTGLIPTSMLLVPVADERGDVIGVLSVLDRSVATADALAIATAFGDHLSTLLPSARDTADQARVLLAAVADAARSGDPDLAEALRSAIDDLPEREAELAIAAAAMQRLRGTDPATRQRAVRLVGEVVELATTTRRR